jgi:hypothetical protein
MRGAAAAAAAFAMAVSGCAGTKPTDYDPRITEARRGLEEDAAVQARTEEVEAALERERGEAVIDDFQVRVGDRNDGDNTVRVLTRIPVPNPGQLRARRAMRQAETQASVARLEEAALQQRAEICLRSVEGALHRESAQLYVAYAERQEQLLAWNQDWRGRGVLDVGTATRFEIERQIELAQRLPDPPPIGPTEGAELPGIEPPAARLDKSAARVRELVGQRHPSVAVHQAISQRYDAMSDRAANQRLPWFDFVDIAYEAKQRASDEIGGQVAVRVPIGPRPGANASRYQALSRAELRDGDRVVAEQLRAGLASLEEIDRFETNADRWSDLLELARDADQVSAAWRDQRLKTPSTVANLVDRAYDARATVLRARARAGLASCQLLATTGVPIDEWPRLESSSAGPVRE